MIKRFKKGLTLIELVVTIAVVAILTGAAVGTYFGVTESSKHSRAETEALTFFSEVQKILNNYNLEDKPYVGLCRLFVHKSLRSHGIGTFLIQQMEEKYKGENFIFFVHLTNLNALRLYEQLGFKNLGIYNYPFGEFYTFIK